MYKRGRMIFHRNVLGRLSFMAAHFPVVMVCGARQVGKTTLLKEFAQKNGEINYVTLGYPNVRELAKSDPALFLKQYKKENAPLIIDEIQYVPEILSYIKIYVDENALSENCSGQFFLTGSQMFYLMKNVSESLAGRVGIISLYSFSRREIFSLDSVPFLPANDFSKIKKTSGKSSVFDDIYRGGMPKMITDPELSPEDFFGSYMQTYLERDIRDLINIKNESKFLKFISCVAARTAQEVNLSDISKDVGIDRKTAESYLSILVSSGIVYLLSPYSANTIKRIVKRPKLYFMDTGLSCYLSPWNNSQALEVSAMAGNMFETYVVSEIIKSYANAGIDVRNRLFYYRDNNKKEIDLLIVQNGKIYPIEIKKGASPTKEALKNFSVLESLGTETGDGAVICQSDMIVPLDEKNSLIPFEYI